jgi:hypothetical protein
MWNGCQAAVEEIQPMFYIRILLDERT